MIANLLVSIILLHRPDYDLQPSAHYGIFACIVILASFSTMCIGNRYVDPLPNLHVGP